MVLIVPSAPIALGKRCREDLLAASDRLPWNSPHDSLMNKPRSSFTQTLFNLMLTNGVSDKDGKVEREFLSYQHLRIECSYNQVLHCAMQQRHLIGARREVEP